MGNCLNPITFRLRQYKDADLISEFEKLDVKIDRAEVIREALRTYFGITGAIAPVEGVKRHRGAVCELQGYNMSAVDIVKVEKSDNQIGDALDDLLNKF